MIQKRILVPDRLRRPPATGWSWVDRRFVREHADHLSREAVLLYFFLCRRGRPARAVVLRRRHAGRPAADAAAGLVQARDELLAHDLIAHEPPLTQVLSLPPPGQRRRSEPGQGLMQLGDILRQAIAIAAFRPGKEPAMNVALWAEIRRLAEIEKLSGRAISRRLHCSRHTVAAALELDAAAHAPRRHAAPACLDPYKDQDRRPAGQVSRTLGGAHPRGDRPRPRRLSPAASIVIRRYLRTIRPARGRVYQEVHYEPAQAMQVDWGECGRVQVGDHDPQGLGVRGRALLQPVDLHRVHPLAAQGRVLPRPGAMPSSSSAAVPAP